MQDADLCWGKLPCPGFVPEPKAADGHTLHVLLIVRLTHQLLGWCRPSGKQLYSKLSC